MFTEELPWLSEQDQKAHHGAGGLRLVGLGPPGLRHLSALSRCRCRSGSDGGDAVLKGGREVVQSDHGHGENETCTIPDEMSCSAVGFPGASEHIGHMCDMFAITTGIRRRQPMDTQQALGRHLGHLAGAE